MLLLDDAIGRLHLDPIRDQPWFALLGGNGELVIPDEDLEAAVTSLLELPRLPPLELPEEVYLSEEAPVPEPRLVLEPEDAPEWMKPQLEARLSFTYGGLTVDAGDPRSAVVDWEEHRFVRRDLETEQEALVRLLELGLKPVASKSGHSLELEPARSAGGRRAASPRRLGSRGPRRLDPIARAAGRSASRAASTGSSSAERSTSTATRSSSRRSSRRSRTGTAPSS